MLFKPNFPRMKKFRYNGKKKYYGLEKVHRDKEKLEDRGKKLCRRGKALQTKPFDDYKIIEKENCFALYML